MFLTAGMSKLNKPCWVVSFSFSVLVFAGTWGLSAWACTWLSSCNSFLCEHFFTLRKHLCDLTWPVLEILIKRVGLVICSVLNSHTCFLFLQQFSHYSMWVLTLALSSSRLSFVCLWADPVCTKLPCLFQEGRWNRRRGLLTAWVL